ncbi:MAG: PhoH family protein, partial [Candidatus Paceibacterota bacterium]
MTKYYLPDTNVFLNNISITDEYPIVVSSHVLRELEKIESNEDRYGNQSYKAREARRHIKSHKDKIHMNLKDYQWRMDDELDSGYEDNRILQCCIDNDYGIITFDGLLAEKALLHGIEVVDTEEFKPKDDYHGYKEVYMTQDEYTKFYQERLNLNEFDLLVNQYLVIRDDITGKELDALKYDGEYHISVRNKGFNTKLLGSFKPMDLPQSCVLDSFQHNQMTMVKGRPGSGKSLIALNYAIQQLERNKIDKLICFVNPVASRNSAKLGFYPGTRDEKILDSNIGSMLAGKFGDKFQVESMIANNQLLLLPFSDIRGFDTTGMNALVYIVEAQNLDIDLMKLAIQRVGDDSRLIIDGDYSAQVDHSNY